MSTRINNTGQQPSTMVGGQLAKLFDLMSIRTIKGFVDSPTSIASYAVTTVPDADGNTSAITLSPEEVVVGCVLYGPALTSDGAATFDVGSAATSGAGISVSFMAAAASLAQAVAGRLGIGNSLAAVGANEFVSLTVAGAVVTGGDLYVTLLVMNAKHPQ